MNLQNRMNNDLLEYAQLLSEDLNTTTQNLPSNNWKRICTLKRANTNASLYTFYINEKSKEIILSICDQKKLFNYLSDVDSVIQALIDDVKCHQDSQDLTLVHQNDQELFDLMSINKSFNEFIQFEQDIRNWVISLLYIGAVTTGLFRDDTLVPLDMILPVLISYGIMREENMDLLDLKLLVNHRIREKLSTRSLEEVLSINELILKPIQQHKSGFQFKIIGHSIGGLIGELIALEIGVPCVSFESPGCCEIATRIDRYKNRLYQNLISTYLSAPNIINTLNGHPGKVFRLFLPHTLKSFSWGHLGSCSLNMGSMLATYATLGTFSYAAILIKKGIETAAVTYGKVALGSLIGTNFLGGVIGLWSDTGWLERQHDIKHIIAYLSSKVSTPICEIESWPSQDAILQKTVDKIGNFFRDNFVPFQQDSPGIRNILNEEKMREAQIKKIPGYSEKK